MNRMHTRRGFTLAELLVAMVAASVLVLTAGALLWYTQGALTRLRGVVDVHRDMRASTEVLTRMTRAGTGFTFTTGFVYTVTYTSRPPARVALVSNNLIYTPNLTVPAATQVLARGTVDRFSVSVATNRAEISLVLVSPVETMSNRLIVTRRN